MNKLIDEIHTISNICLSEHIDLKSWFFCTIPAILKAMSESNAMNAEFSCKYENAEQVKEEWKKLLASMGSSFLEANSSLNIYFILHQYDLAKQEYLDKNGTLDGFEDSDDAKRIIKKGQEEAEWTRTYREDYVQKSLAEFSKNIDYLNCNLDLE